jgi:hypothetical protein
MIFIRIFDSSRLFLYHAGNKGKVKAMSTYTENTSNIAGVSDPSYFRSKVLPDGTKTGVAYTQDAIRQGYAGGYGSRQPKQWKPDFSGILFQWQGDTVRDNDSFEEVTGAQLGWDLREFLESFSPDRWWANEPEPT